MAFPAACSAPSSSAVAECLPTVYDLGESNNSGEGCVEDFFTVRDRRDVQLVRAWAPLARRHSSREQHGSFARTV
jgi:hypothetical protein